MMGMISEKRMEWKMWKEPKIGGRNQMLTKITTPITFFKMFETMRTWGTTQRGGKLKRRAKGKFSGHRRHCAPMPFYTPTKRKGTLQMQQKPVENTVEISLNRRVYQLINWLKREAQQNGIILDKEVQSFSERTVLQSTRCQNITPTKCKRHSGVHTRFKVPYSFSAWDRVAPILRSEIDSIWRSKSKWIHAENTWKFKSNQQSMRQT